METRANYILVGAFTILGFLGLLGFIVWFSKTELDRSFAYYDVYFTSVSGLNNASDVRYAGLTVGQVVSMQLAERGDGTVRVRLEVDANTPIRAGAEATIEAQGVTGVALVSISPGDPTAPLLVTEAGAEAPEIPAGQSVLQALSEDAPELLSEARSVMVGLNTFLTPENSAHVSNILANLESASAQLDTTLTTFANVTEDVGDAVGEISSFTDQLSDIGQAVTDTLQSAQGTVSMLENVSSTATETLQSGTRALDLMSEYIDNDLRVALGDFIATSTEIRGQAVRLGDGAVELVDVWTDTGRIANARLIEAEALLAETDIMLDDLVVTLAAMEEAAVEFDELVEIDGTILVEETQAMVETANRTLTVIGATLERDWPEISADIVSAVDTAERLIAEAGQNITDATADVSGLTEEAQTALREATTTFQTANQTLQTVDAGIITAERALVAAERALNGAADFLEEDVDGLTEEVRVSVNQLLAAVDSVVADLPAVTADVRRAAASAEASFADIAQIIAGAEAPIDSFLNDGLSDYARLGREIRSLVATVEGLVEEIERDPARFFLGGDTPRYRR